MFQWKAMADRGISDGFRGEIFATLWTMLSRATIRRSVPFPALLALLCLLVLPAHRDAGAAISPVDRVVVYKGQRIMQLLKGEEVVRSYQVALGRNPSGHKQTAGDHRTPEGTYLIDRHNKGSRFYKSLHISYPNSRDVSAARERGRSPGGDIMIHGLPRGFEDLADLHYLRDWTKGCIAVNNAEMDEIFRLVNDGTPIEIKP